MAIWNGSTGGISQAQAQAACSAAITAASLPTAADISETLTPTDLKHAVTLGAANVLIAGTAGFVIEVWGYTATAAGSDGSLYQVGWSNNDNSNFVAWTPSRQVGSIVTDSQYIASEVQPRAVGQPLFTAPDGKAFACTSESVFDLEYWYRVVAV